MTKSPKALIDFKFALSKTSHNDENKAYHLIQSFLPGEVDFDTAHQIGMELADKVLEGKYSYVVSTHIDKDHIHNHVICAPIPGRSESAITSGQRVVSC